MRVVFLRRRKLGRTSCREIGGYMAEILNIPVVTVRNDTTALVRAEDVLIRWGCTSASGRGPDGYRTGLNSPSSIHWCNDKAGSRLHLQEVGVSVSRSWLGRDFDGGREGKSYILRPPTHAQGRRLYYGEGDYICNKVEELGLESGYVSEYIHKVAEYRVMVVAGRAAWVARKTPSNPEDIAWNVARGGRFDNLRWGEWPMSVVYEALRAARESGTDFCGVDVMVDAVGTPYILEVNSAPSHTSPYRQQATAKALANLIQTQVTYPLLGYRLDLSWRDVIHPAHMETRGE